MSLMALIKTPHPEVPREARPRRTHGIPPVVRHSCPASESETHRCVPTRSRAPRFCGLELFERLQCLTSDYRLVQRERWTPAFRRGSQVDWFTKDSCLACAFNPPYAAGPKRLPRRCAVCSTSAVGHSSRFIAPVGPGSGRGPTCRSRSRQEPRALLPGTRTPEFYLSCTPSSGQSL